MTQRILAVFIVALASSAQGNDPVTAAMPASVKIYGAGGSGRLEGYASGAIVSSAGYIATVYGPVLDTPSLRVVLSDGRTFPAQIVGVDSPRDIAILQIQANDLPSFDLESAASPSLGTDVWVITNLFGLAQRAEPLSVQRGILCARTQLPIRRGTAESSYPGEVFLIDAILSNPGSAGGPVIIGDGKLVGIVGKEVRSAELAIWINYVIPVQNIRSVLEAVLEGRAETNPKPPRTQEPNRRQLAGVDLRGIRLLPEVLDRTPPFVDGVEIDSPAELAGLRPDDLVVYIGETLVEDTADLRAALLEVSTDAPIKVVVLRNEELLALELTASNPSTEEPAP